MEDERERLRAALAAADDGRPHSATWWRQQARSTGIEAGYGEVGEALAEMGIAPFDLKRGNLYRNCAPMTISHPERY